MTRVRAWADDRVITIHYDPTGLAWAQLTEHHVESWNVYETGAVPTIVPGARGRVLTVSPLWEPRITSLLSLARTMSASWPTLCLSQGQTAARCSVPADGVA